MLINLGDAVSLSVAATLLSLGLVLAWAGRRRVPALVLAIFLVLVGLNFLANGVLTLAGEPVPGWWAERNWLAWWTLAWDPLFLLAFVTLYPYRRQGPGVLALLGFVGAACLVAGTWTLAPGRVRHFGSSPHEPLGDPLFVLIIGTMAVAYTAAWILSLRTAREAPTPHLARRSAWLVAAVGVATVPRLLLVPLDLRLFGLLDTTDFVATNLHRMALVGLGLPVAGLVYYLGWREATGGASGLARSLRRALAVVGVATGILVATSVASAVFNAMGADSFGFTLFYGPRWLIFTALLVHGVLAYEIVDFPRASERLVPALGAGLGALAAGLLTLAVLPTASLPASAGLALATAVGFGASVPCAVGARGLARWLRGFDPSPTVDERRLELYRAAVEVAYVEGLPDASARRRLERDRRAFGVSVEEARIIEHMVASGLTGGTRALRPGDEAAPGVVVRRVLGEGAHGRAWLAKRLPGGQRLVVKELFPVDGAGARARLLTELRALQDLDHPHIVALQEVRVDAGRHVLVMGYVEAEPLDARMARVPPRDDEVRAWAAQLLSALEAAHTQGVVHRDLKPSNILVDVNGNAHLTDFGVASVSDGAPVQATLTGLGARGALVGTLAYMAPEQARGERADARADLYALGLVLYECVTGRRALDLSGCGLYDALERVVDPSVDLAPVPAHWRPVLEGVLAPEPCDRPASAAEMTAVLAGPAQGPAVGSGVPSKR